MLGEPFVENISVSQYNGRWDTLLDIEPIQWSRYFTGTRETPLTFLYPNIITVWGFRGYVI